MKLCAKMDKQFFRYWTPDYGGYEEMGSCMKYKNLEEISKNFTKSTKYCKQRSPC